MSWNNLYEYKDTRTAWQKKFDSCKPCQKAWASKSDKFVLQEEDGIVFTQLPTCRCYENIEKAIPDDKGLANSIINHVKRNLLKSKRIK